MLRTLSETESARTMLRVTTRIIGSGCGKLDQIRPTGHGILMNAIEMRIVPKAHQFQFQGPSCRPGSKLS